MQANTDVTIGPEMTWAIFVFLAAITALFYFGRKFVDHLRNRPGA
jgi:hypothetical protein